MEIKKLKKYMLIVIQELFQIHLKAHVQEHILLDGKFD